MPAGRQEDALGSGARGRGVAAELAEQPGARLQPLSLRRAQRDAECRRGFLFAVAGEEAALDDVGQPGGDLREALQRVIELDQTFVAVDRERFGVGERDLKRAGIVRDEFVWGITREDWLARR